MPSSTHTLDTSSPRFTEALDILRPELVALPAADLERVTVNIEDAVLTALGAAPKLQALRPALVARFGEVTTAVIDRVEVVARAAAKAQTLHVAYLKGKTLEPLSEAVVHERTALLLDAQSLVQRKILDPARIAGLRGVAAYQDQCFDVLQLVSMYREEWPSLTGRTPLTVADLDRAEGAAHRLATELGVRDQAAAGSSPADDLRRRAFTLFVRTYDQARRLVTFLRWHEDDADSIVPSLWAGRASRRAQESVPRSPVPATPPAGAAATPAPSSGLPGASPFVAS